jgi:hypothetical protein
MTSPSTLLGRFLCPLCGGHGFSSDTSGPPSTWRRYCKGRREYREIANGLSNYRNVPCAFTWVGAEDGEYGLTGVGEP